MGDKSLYRFYPSRLSGVFYKIKSGTINWIQDNCLDVNKAKLSSTQFEEAYDLMFQRQIDFIMKTLSGKHLEKAEKFIASLKNKTALYEYENNFHEIHRFFPERVFRVACALALIEDGRSLVKPDSEIFEVLSKLLSQYKLRGGDVGFIANYYFTMRDNYAKTTMDETMTEKDKQSSRYHDSFEDSEKIYRAAGLDVPSPYTPVYSVFGKMVTLVFQWRKDSASLLAQEVSAHAEKFTAEFAKLEADFKKSLAGFDPKMLVCYFNEICTWVGFSFGSNPEYVNAYNLVKDYVAELVSGTSLESEEMLKKFSGQRADSK